MRLITFAVLMVLLIVFMGKGVVYAGEEAGLILINGQVLTMDREMRVTGAVVIKGGKILFTGDVKDALAFRTGETKVLDMRGKTIIPGLHDGHIHFESGTENLVKSLSLRFLDLESIREKIKGVIAASPRGAVIKAVDFNQAYFKTKNWPSCKDLDDISPNNPVIIERVDGHSCWLNSRAMAMCGIGRNTVDPQGGEVQRFADGSPTGILQETAMDLIKNITGPGMVIPGLTGCDPLEVGIHYANELGLTSVTTSGSLELIKKLNELKKQGKLTLRFNVWLEVGDMDIYLEKGVNLGQGDEFVRVSFLKIFADGTIGSATAAMFKPYIHRPDSRGLLIYPEAELERLVEKAHQGNWQIGVHAIGNRGVNLVLNAVEKAQKKHGVKNLRHRIEHSQFVMDGDIGRYKSLGVLPSMQPTHCTSDLLVVEDRIGKEGAREGYRWNSFHQEDIMMVFGTDWPIEPLDPRRGLYSAIERKNIENQQPVGGWFPGEQLSLMAAIKYYTLGSAVGSFNEKNLGSIEPGKYADLTVFDGDILQITATDKRGLLSVPVFMTIVGGKIVFQQDN